MRISTLLQAKGGNVYTIRKDATVEEAVTALSAYRVGALVVSSDGRRVEGIVSERDVVKRLADLHGALIRESVTLIMSNEVVTCSPDDDTESLMATMTDHRIRHVPVVVNDELVGIVSIGDVVKATIDELRKDRDELVSFIHAR